MKVLVIGSGGREHAICTKLKESKLVSKIYCAPGNAGIANVATLVDSKPMDFLSIVDFSKREEIDLVVVAPDNPLAGGLVDILNANDIKAFGPTKRAAEIEGSKAFSKSFMKKYGIPTADYAVFNKYEAAKDYLDKVEKFPIVLKADGLAFGKGVIIAHDKVSAQNSLENMMLSKVFGDAANTVIIEEFLEGPEMTLLCFTDGKTVSAMPSSQDHKKAFDGDKGLNTGGMGAFSPAKAYTPQVEKEIMENIVKKTIDGLNKENRTFKGVLYFGLMATASGVKVIEYNARFGDPETQAILPLLESDLCEIMLATIDGTLNNIDIKWKNKVGFSVVVASGGYPENVIKGYEIEILPLDEDLILYHAGTKESNGKLYTNGGRVFNLSVVADSIDEARKKVYSNIDKIKFTGARYRSDIGIK
ncbi:MAG: phosphoribosylamine--glycine ligase [Clostridiales bacterium]|jgi:phosphoribosylamine--glycine ligase|nr:phosphoribosylamine--glycine ligase [Clostridiales bacterium]